MAVNPNIALSVRGLELPDPLTQYAKVQKIQGAQQQNALTQMQMQQYQRQEEQQNAMNRAYAQAYSPEGGFDQNAMIQFLATSGQGAQIPAVQAQFAKTRQEELAAEKADIEAGLKSIEFGKEMLAKAPQTVEGLKNWFRGQFQDPRSKQIFETIGLDLDGALATVDDADKTGTLAALRDRLSSSWKELRDTIKPTTQFVTLPSGDIVAMSVTPGQAPVELTRFDADMTPAQQESARVAKEKLQLEQRRVALEAREKDPDFIRAKAQAMEQGKLAARDVNVAINTTPNIIEEAGVGLGILTQMIGKRDKDGNLVPGSQPHPGFKGAVGASVSIAVPGTDKRDFQELYNQIMGQAFLQAFERLKGAGQITEIEGQKATAAITSLSLAQSEREFVREAMRLQDQIDQYTEKAVNRYNQLTEGRSDARPMEYTRLNRPMGLEQQRTQLREQWRR